MSGHRKGPGKCVNDFHHTSQSWAQKIHHVASQPVDSWIKGGFFLTIIHMAWTEKTRFSSWMGCLVDLCICVLRIVLMGIFNEMNRCGPLAWEPWSGKYSKFGWMDDYINYKLWSSLTYSGVVLCASWLAFLPASPLGIQRWPWQGPCPQGAYGLVSVLGHFVGLLHARAHQSCLTLCKPMPGSSVYGDSPGKNTGVGCHALLEGIFLGLVKPGMGEDAPAPGSKRRTALLGLDLFCGIPWEGQMCLRHAFLSKTRVLNDSYLW